MATNAKQSELVPLEISSDGGTTWKVLVCRRSSTFNHDTAINEEATDCGTATSPGNNTFGWDFDGVANTSPTSGSQVSWKDLLALATAKTKIKARNMAGTLGAEWYQAGDVYISSLRQTYATGTSVGFSGTFRGVDDLDITP